MVLVEISGPLHEGEVRHLKSGEGELLHEPFEGKGWQKGDGKQCEGQESEGEGRKEALDAAQEEMAQRKRAAIERFHHDPGDEKAGDDKKDIDSEVTSGHPVRVEVKDDNGSHGDRAQNLDVVSLAGFRGHGKSFLPTSSLETPADNCMGSFECRSTKGRQNTAALIRWNHEVKEGRHFRWGSVFVGQDRGMVGEELGSDMIFNDGTRHS